MSVLDIGKKVSFKLVGKIDFPCLDQVLILGCIFGHFTGVGAD